MAPEAIAARQATWISEKINVGKYIVCEPHSMLDFEDAGTFLSVWHVSAEYTVIRLKRRKMHYLGQAWTTLFVRDRRISELYNLT